MLLTGKAKKDFESWVCRPNDPQYVKEMHIDLMYGKSYIELYAYIIEWFDSIGIYINIYHDFNGRFFFDIDNEDSTIKSNFGTSNYNNRIECTRKSIEHANELYNKRNNNQD